MSGKRILITGATGILGSYVLAGALAQGHRPVVLMRDACVSAARERLHKVLALTGQPDREAEVELLQADVCKQDLGLDTAQLRGLRDQLEAVVHCAASVSFEAVHDRLIWETNVRGTGHLLDAIAGTGIPFYYVSTAYVGGAGRDTAHEHELRQQQDVQNCYEHSKVECERLIERLFHDGTLTGAIFRPSILTGAASDGHIVQFLNFYAFLRLIDGAIHGRIPLQPHTRILMNPDSTMNLIPVDWAAAALWRIIARAFPTPAVYHLTHPDPPKQQIILDWANSRLPAGTSVVGRCVLTEPVLWPERLALRQLQPYRNYMLGECRFDRTNTDAALAGTLPVPPVNGLYFDLLLEYARARQWRRLFAPSRNTSAPAIPQVYTDRILAT